MSDILHQLREELQRGNNTVPARPSIPLFAAHPIECDELLQELFEAFDGGAENAYSIRLLLALQQAAKKFPSKKRREALTLQDVLRSAYGYPPTCIRTMSLQLRDVVQLGAPGAACEQMVRDYPSFAQKLLTQLLRTQKHDRFYNVWNVRWQDTRAEICALRSMIARAEGSRLLVEMEE